MSGRTGTRTLRPHLPALILVCLVGGLLLAFFLGVYAAHHYPMPIGYDTPRYLFQTNLVARYGLAGVPQVLPPPIKSLVSRTGFPVLTLTLASLFSTSTFVAAATVPATAAVAIALAGGALVTWSLRRGAWDLVVIALVLGTSAVAIRLMAPETYTDNLLAAAVFVAALIPAMAAAQDGRAFVGAIVLFGVGGLIHPPLFEVMLATLGIVLVLCLPGSLRSWRGGAGILQTPSARLAVVGAGSAAFTALAFAALVRTAPVGITQTRFELRKKMRQDVPFYRFWLTAPLGAIGVGSAAADRRPRSRLLLAVLLAWAGVATAGVVAFLAGRNTPAHRFLAFLLPLPLFIGLGFLAVGRMIAARGPRAIGALVVASGVVGLGLLGAWQFYVELPRERGIEWLDVGKVQDAASAAAYLDAEHVPRDAPVVFVIDDRGPNPLSIVPEMAYMIRAMLPAERIPHAYVYVGDPANYLAGRPTYRPTPGQYNPNVKRFWPTVQRLLPRRPVALLLSAYNPAYAAFAASHPDLVVVPDVAVLNGPSPTSILEPPPIPRVPHSPVRAGLAGVGTLVVIALVGLGWALVLLPTDVRAFEVLALSPAVGIGLLVLAGSLVDGVGIRLTGAAGALTVIGVALAGLAGAAVRALRSGRAVEAR